MDNINISKLDLNLLRTFVVLMEERNVSRASERLSITQSAASNALERLRDSLNDRIMVREGRVMQPTNAALVLWPKISQALADIDSALEAYRDPDPATMQHRFNIGIDQYSMLLFGNSLVEKIQAIAPGVTLAFHVADPSRYTEQLTRAEVDLLVVPVWQSLPELVSRTLYSEKFVGLMRKGHPLDGLKMTPKRYVAYPHLLVSSRGIVEGNVDAGLRHKNLQRIVNLSIPWFDTAPGYLMYTDSLLNMGRRLSLKMLQRYPIVQFDLPLDVPGFDVCMLWHPRSTTDPHHAWMREQLHSVFSQEERPDD